MKKNLASGLASSVEIEASILGIISTSDGDFTSTGGNAKMPKIPWQNSKVFKIWKKRKFSAKHLLKYKNQPIISLRIMDAAKNVKMEILHFVSLLILENL